MNDVSLSQMNGRRLISLNKDFSEGRYAELHKNFLNLCLLCTVAPLLSPVQEVGSSPNDITIEMHMHDRTEVCHFIIINTHVVSYLCSIMHMHFYCYVIGGTAYLLDRGKEWCYSDLT